MAVDLNTILQHVGVPGSGLAEDKPVYITRQGDISTKSGLGFLQRHFSSSSKIAENHATLETFKNSIMENPKYRTYLESEPLPRFFLTKHQEGTPLTAREIQDVKLTLDLEKTGKVGRELAELGVIPENDSRSFAWFCVAKGITLSGVDESKEAVKAYYATNSLCDNKARAALDAAGVKPENMGAALKLLKSSDAWTSALNAALEGNVRELNRDIILDAFLADLGPAADLLADMTGTLPQAKGFLERIAFSGDSQGISQFNGILGAVKGGTITREEGPLFMGYCVKENLDPGSPGQLISAIVNFRVEIDAETTFMSLAKSNGLPEGVGKSLAHNPELTVRMNRVLIEAFPPPAIPTREEIGAVMDQTAEKFLAEKNGAVRNLLALAGKSGDFGPVLAGRAGEVTEQFICEMLNPLLAGQTMTSHLLDPGKGPNLDLIRHLEDFQIALASCGHTVQGVFGGDQFASAAEKCLAVIMGSHRADGGALGSLLAGVQKNFSVIGHGLESMNSGLGSSALKAANFDFSSHSIFYVQSALRRIAGFAHGVTSLQDKKALGIDEDMGKFLQNLELGPNGETLPMDDIHQSVRAFGLARGVKIEQRNYAETTSLAKSEAMAFTGTSELPEVTDLLKAQAGAIAREFGLAGSNPGDLDPVVLRASIERAINSRNDELLNPAQARALAVGAIREYVQNLDPVLFIQSLPTRENTGPDAPPKQFVITEAEKQHLLRVIPGTSLQDTALIKAVIMESRNIQSSLKKLAVPGLRLDDMIVPLLTINSEHMRTIRPFEQQSTDKDGVRDAYKAALTLALDGLNLAPSQEMDMYNLISGPKGKEIGGGLMGLLAMIGEPKNHEDGRKKLLGATTCLDSLRMILGPRVGVGVEEEPSYYRGAATNAQDIAQDIPPAVLNETVSTLGIRSVEISCYTALSMVAPEKLPPGEWGTLMPVLRMAGQSMSDPSDSYKLELALKMTAANARELLAAVEANQGRPLSPRGIWRVVIGGRAPIGLTGENLGTKMFEAATQAMFKRAKAIRPELTRDEVMPLIEFALGRGIPCQTIFREYQPGGRLGPGDVRLEQPSLSSLANYTPDNAYGLVTDWGRRQEGQDGTPSSMTIHTGPGSGFTINHRPVPAKENTPGNPIFVKIMESCRSICSSDLQFMRVMQSLSQASTVNLRLLVETSFPGMGLSEHGHFDSTVRPQGNGNVVVELAKGPGERPFGAHIQITVSPTGEASVTDFGVEWRREELVA